MIAGFGLTLAAAAEPPPPTFIDRELHASYTVPVGWEQIPQKYVDLVSQEAIRATGQPGIHYLAAYQPKGLQWLTGPYILVSHIVTGGPSLDELRQLMETGTQQMERKLNSGDSGSIESMEVGKPTVDRARQLIVIPLHATVTQVGPVLGVAAMVHVAQQLKPPPGAPGRPFNPPPVSR
ncbi:MAG TPA: hypothetical protein PK413_08435 [Thermoanaerobaculia bacterium]|nr:hypothetical protein [Thermoanaerobaculia bacterium]